MDTSHARLGDPCTIAELRSKTQVKGFWKTLIHDVCKEQGYRNLKGDSRQFNSIFNGDQLRNV